jgi:hypothetical protein
MRGNVTSHAALRCVEQEVFRKQLTLDERGLKFGAKALLGIIFVRIDRRVTGEFIIVF